MDITIIIVNWNAEKLLQNCVKSVFCTKGDLEVQVIVVDNGSTDNSLKLLDEINDEVEVIASKKNLGFGRACNLALKNSKAPIVMFLNPDTSIQKNSLQTICNFFKKNKMIGAIGCKIIDKDDKIQPLMIQKYSTPFLEFIKLFAMNERSLKILRYQLPVKKPSEPGEVIKLSGACLTVRKKILDKLSGFDERFFMYCEDGELCERITKKGWKLYYLTDAEVVHHQGSCSRKAPKGFSTLMQCESFSKYMEKKFGKVGLAKYRLLMFFGSSIRMLVSFTIFLSYKVIKKNNAELWIARIKKNLLIFQWSIFIAKPIIPD